MTPDLSFLLQFDSRLRFRTRRGAWEGTLECPHCGPATFVEHEAIVEFTIFGIGLFPTRRLGPLVVCSDCHNPFEVPAGVAGLPSVRAGRR